MHRLQFIDFRPFDFYRVGRKHDAHRIEVRFRLLPYLDAIRYVVAAVKSGIVTQVFHLFDPLFKSVVIIYRGDQIAPANLEFTRDMHRASLVVQKPIQRTLLALVEHHFPGV